MYNELSTSMKHSISIRHDFEYGHRLLKYNGNCVCSNIAVNVFMGDRVLEPAAAMSDRSDCFSSVIRQHRR